MAEEPPLPPADLPPTLVEALDDCSSEHLVQIATYAEELADYRERSSGTEEDRETTDEEDPGERDDQGQKDGSVPEGCQERKERPDDQLDDRPDEVPSKATITIKEINDNRYYYWQWRDGDRIRSQYEGPVDSDGSS